MGQDEVETRLGKVEKDLKGQMSSMAEQCDDALKNMRIKFMKEIDDFSNTVQFGPGIARTAVGLHVGSGCFISDRQV